MAAGGGQRDAVGGKRRRKVIAGEEVILRRTQGGEWIEPLELVVDEAGVAHDEPSFRQTL
jgi:hypothetical protein